MSSNITDMADKNATAAQTISLSFDNVRLVNDSSPSFCLILNPQIGSQVACEIKICHISLFSTRDDQINYNWHDAGYQIRLLDG